jgi:hypothetical protein
MRYRMPSSNFCGCTSGFRKSAHILNKPIGSCYLKYAGTRGRFYYYIYLLVGPSIVDRFPLPPVSPPIGDTSLTHVMRLAAHSTTSPTPTAMGQSFLVTL